MGYRDGAPGRSDHRGGSVLIELVVSFTKKPNILYGLKKLSSSDGLTHLQTRPFRHAHTGQKGLYQGYTQHLYRL